MQKFEVVSDFLPAGDQPEAIEALAAGIERGDKYQTLLGITGSGKSATVAWLIEKVQRPTLVLAPNKSLAAQLANEYREFFPNNRVEYFVSYYDYYQPEAYMPSSDTYIEKDSSVNDEIDRLRHASTSALLTRRDVIVVASVSCIYGMGSPEEYKKSVLILRQGEERDQRDILRKLVDIQYERNDMNLVRGKFRVRGDTIEIHPAYDETAVRIELFGDEVEQITVFDPLTGERLETKEELVVFPATHYVSGEERMQKAIVRIEDELQRQLSAFEKEGKLLEAQRLRMRTQYDLEMMQEVGFCNGIENYSGPIDGRERGEPPNTLIDFFPDDFLLIVDESHVAVPQLHGQYQGDRSRKATLIDHGFRLPSAADNRPLQFEEFSERVNQCVFLSATPSDYELRVSQQVVEQIVRPTGLIDPEVIIKPTKGQIDDLLDQIKARVEVDSRVLVTTLTKKMAEDLTDYLLEMGVRVRYLHSEVDTVQRIEILRDLRLGEFDVLVGINLLREGLDLPEVSLVAILDADKEGFLRSETSLIQTIGRAARNVEGQVIMYADKMTDSMQRAISETNRRRGLQQEYNKKHGIDPQTIRKAVSNILEVLRPNATTPLPGQKSRASRVRDEFADLPPGELHRLISTLEEEMREASADLRFEYAARLRDEIQELKRELRERWCRVNDLSKLLKNPLAASLIVLVAYFGLAFLNDDRAYLGTDTGGKVATLYAMSEADSLHPDIGYWAEEFDEDGSLHPQRGTTRVEHGWVNVTTLPAIYAGLPLYEVGGYRLALLVPMLGSLAAAFAARSLTRRLRGTSDQRFPIEWQAFWLVALASPATIYAMDFWEHSIGLALMAWGVVALVAVYQGSSPAVAVLGGAAFGLAATMRTESLLYGFVCTAVFCTALLLRGRSLVRPVIVGIGSSVGLASMWVANILLESQALGESFRAGRVSGTATNSGAELGFRVREGLVTSVGLFARRDDQSILIGLLVVGVSVIALTVLARSSSGLIPRVAIAVVTGLFVLRILLGVGFVPGALMASPVAIAGLYLVTRDRLSPSELLDTRFLLAAISLGALPLVWFTQFPGGAIPQWGGRYVLTSGLLLTVLGVLALAEHPAKAARAWLFGTSVAMTIFGLAWVSVRTHDFGEAGEPLAARGDQVIVFDEAFLPREWGPLAVQGRWLRAHSDEMRAEMLEVMDDAEVTTFALAQIGGRSIPHFEGWTAVGTERFKLITNTDLQLTGFTRG